ncbi:GNAT family N-acetyltransferase [Ktedonosporobacter rubrisoli]|uniref:GNAT family N-acetyltransferase n=1 Tax=Ktedonosporobacter rubrisoli TaxID=2509675 RepID=A0A4P6JID0_KTERU|nr:GNAT family N-acetyltransferase [Ktedonosporobacter rubrisoli]QBD74808.1 GNAT family N-acetyltransferase [Ktedonosporobacter rubrisoli]
MQALNELSIERPQTSADLTELEKIWAASQDEDNAAFRPGDGWWSFTSWATAVRIVRFQNKLLGAVGINVSPEAPDVAEVRLALLPVQRQSELSQVLIREAKVLAQEAGACVVRIYIPARATWAREAANAHHFSLKRTQYVMLLPAERANLALQSPEDIDIRQLGAGEEEALLVALNRAWADTWNFRQLTMQALRADLDGTQNNFLVAISPAANGEIIGTVQAQFDAHKSNQDAGSAYAWISNLTIVPGWRGKGLGRILLKAGINQLIARGARSIALGVDGGAVAPVGLYRSLGFEIIDTVEIWESALQ